MNARPLRTPSDGTWLLAVLSVGVLVRVAVLGQESYWFDEIWSVNLARLSFSDMMAVLVREDVHPPLYPVLLWGWVRVFGHAEWATRLLSALVGAAAIAPLYAIGRRLFDSRTGLVAAALLALNAYAVFYGRESRAYSLMLLTSFVATWLLLRLLERPTSWRRLTGYAAGATVLAYTHVYGLFVLIAHGVYVLAFLPAVRRRFLLAALLVAGAFAPWAPFLLGQMGRVQEGFWIDPIRWSDPADWIVRWAGYSIPLAVLLIGLGLLAARERPPQGASPVGSRRAFLGLWLLFPLAIPITLSLAAQPIFYHKYPITILGPFLLLAARGLVTLPGRARLGVAATVAALLLVQLPREIYLRPNKEQWRELSELARAESHRGAVIAAEGYNRPYLPYYLDDTEILWIDAPEDLARAEALARAGDGRILYLEVHPQKSDREPALDARWTRTGVTELVGARAARYVVGPQQTADLPEVPDL